MDSELAIVAAIEEAVDSLRNRFLEVPCKYSECVLSYNIEPERGQVKIIG